MSYVLVGLPVQLNTNGVHGFNIVHVRACTDCGAVVYDQGLHDRHHGKGAAALVIGAVQVNAKAALAAFRQGWKDGGTR